MGHRLCWWLSTFCTLAQPSIGLLTVEYRSPHVPWWAPLCWLTRSHTPTPEYLGALLQLTEGDVIDSASLREDLLRLRSAAELAEVSSLLDTLSPSSVELRWIVTPRCRALIAPEVMLGSSVQHKGIATRLPFPFGSQGDVHLLLRHRPEFGIGWAGLLGLTLHDGVRQFSGFGSLHRHRGSYWLQAESIPTRFPFRRWNGGLRGEHTSGTFWDFRRPSPIPYRRRETRLSGWLSWGTWRRDYVFITFAGHWQRAFVDSAFRRAFDNTAFVLIGVSSLAQRYEWLPSPYVTGDSCVAQTGAWGAVTLGIGVPTGPAGELVSYIAGELEHSATLSSYALIAGRIAAGNAFANRLPRATTLELSFTGWGYLFPPLLLQWEGRHQNVWNWLGYRAERLDVLTGFPAPFPSAGTDNRTTLRTKLCWRGRLILPELGWYAALTYYLGALWNQGTKITRLQWRNAISTTLGLHVGGRWTLRWVLAAELAYSPTLRRFFALLRTEIPTTSWQFHRYRPPYPLGAPLTEEP
ncbi:MAG: hypothetical protein ABDH31_04890 [Chlorobiota bacterium]